MPAGQPIIVVVVLVVVVLVLALTSPLWVRVVIKIGKAIGHQLNDAGAAVNREIDPPPQEPKDQV